MMNGQIAIRGVADAFDEWAAGGCTGWSAKDVMPLFSVIEDDFEFGDSAGHGRGGPLPVYRAPPEKWGPIDRGLRDAALASAIRGAPTSTVRMARASPAIRSTAATAAASPPMRAIWSRRAAAPIWKSAGTRWSIASLIRDGRATGVRVHIEGQGSSEISAREIVLCAGAIHSPAILLRSGIGPADELKAMGIAVERDLPVGRHFFDHPLFRATIQLREESAADRSGYAPYQLLRDLFVRACRWRQARHDPDRLQPPRHRRPRRHRRRSVQRLFARSFEAGFDRCFDRSDRRGKHARR